MSPKTRTQKPRRSATTARKTKGFTAEERAAARDRIRELSGGANDESALLKKVAEMPEPDRGMAKRIHAIVKAAAPGLSPRTWYGMPAYAKDDKVVCFFKSADKFKSRYATFGFEEAANIDQGAMWPTSFALTKLTPADEKKLGALVKKAVR